MCTVKFNTLKMPAHIIPKFAKSTTAPRICYFVTFFVFLRTVKE